ncbi:MAG TPA: hypothetical protein VGG19_04825 [Tepidisphaeraceae bacterium]
MDLTNDAYLILIHGKTFTERYYRDKAGWLKISARNRKFRMTAEQVLNHILPLLAGLKPIAKLEVKHRPKPAKKSLPSKHAMKLTKKRPPVSR